MNVANTDYIQATIEIFGFIINVVVGMIFWIITGNEKKSEKILFAFLILSGLALLFDAGWYINDGKNTTMGIFLNRGSNFAIFLTNPLMLAANNGYLCSIIGERNGKPNRVLTTSINIMAIATFLFPISNLFINWMYYFDAENIYHRMTGWYVYTGVNSTGLVACFVMVLIYRKYISYRRRIALYFLAFAPFIGIAVQSANLGLSFIQLGTALGSIGIVVSYLFEWIHKEKTDNDLSEDKRRLWLIECVFAIMILFVSAAIISCVVSVNKVSEHNSEQNSTALAYMVGEAVDGALSEPIDVSRTMSRSHVIIDALASDNLEGSAEEAKMLDYLKRLKKEYGYQMIFVASEKTKAYYTYDGLSRYMQVDSDSRDAWYNEYLGSGVRYELNVDEDKDNNMSLAVFVNMEVRDDDNNFLGVCGVAKSIDSLMEILLKYENQYSLNISLTDTLGIIQIDTEPEMIGQELPEPLEQYADSDKVYYEKNNSRAWLSKYMSGPGWYLVIEDHNPNKLNIFEMVFPSMVIYILGVVLMIAFSFYFSLNERKRSRQLSASIRLSETDGLTGLKNRYSLERFIEKSQKEGIPEALSIIMLDLNGLKDANDILGHDAGDELIKGISKCLTDVFDGTGDIFRTGGDEFVVTCYSDEESIKKMLVKLENTRRSWKGLLVEKLEFSVGMASYKKNPDCTVSELLKLADDEMYRDKEAYYVRVGKEHRKHRESR